MHLEFEQSAVFAELLLAMTGLTVCVKTQGLIAVFLKEVEGHH